jgi:NADH:ubiquinone oxidoreductase subunit K
LVVILAFTILWAARRAPERRGAIVFFGFLSLSVGAALYSWSYDHYLSIGCGVVALGVAGATTSRRAITIATFALFLPVALLLWLSAFARYHDTGSGLVPVLAILLLAAAARAATLTSSAVSTGITAESVSVSRENASR